MTNHDESLLAHVGRKRFMTVLADPPWRFANRTGKTAPEHRGLSRYGTMRRVQCDRNSTTQRPIK